MLKCPENFRGYERDERTERMHTVASDAFSEIDGQRQTTARQRLTTIERQTSITKPKEP